MKSLKQTIIKTCQQHQTHIEHEFFERQIYSQIHDLLMDEKYYKALEQACFIGNIKYINLSISKGTKIWDRGLLGACKGGYLDIAKLMIKKGANHWDMGLEGACVGGNMNIIQLMIEQGANNWDLGLLAACVGGHLNLAKFMISSEAWPISIFDTYWTRSQGLRSLKVQPI